MPDNEKGAAHDGPLAVNGVKFGALAQAFLALHDVLQAAGELRPAFEPALDHRQALAALLPAILEDETPGAGRHALHEAMDAPAGDGMRLVGALRGHGACLLHIEA